MSAWAKPGVRCVCIGVMPNFHPTFSLEVGRIYTIRSTAISPSGDTSIALEEMVNDDSPFWADGPYWHSSQFRPLVNKTIEDDMEHFLPLLNTVQEDA